MPFVYILYSESLDRYYVGLTHGAIEERLYRHNHRHKGFTSVASDREPVYSVSFSDYPSAQSREKEIKNWKSRKFIEHLIKHS